MHPRTQQYRLVAVLFLGWFLSYFDRFLINIAVPFIGKEYHVSEMSLGLLLSVFFAGYALVQIPGGWLADRLGARKVMVFSVLMVSLFTALTGLAWSFVSLIAVRFLFGLSEGGFPTASFRALSEYFPKHERSKIQSVLLSSNPLALVLAPVVAAPLIYWLGWRNMFIVVSIFGLAVTAVYAMALGKPTEPAASAAVSAPTGQTRSIFRSVLVWKISVVNFMLNILIWGFLSWLPSYFLKVHRLDLLHVGLLSALPGIAGIVGMLTGGWLSDAWFANREKHLLIASVGVSALCLVTMINVSLLPVVIACQLLMTFALKLAFIAIWSMPLKFEDTSSTGATAGVINLGSQLAGVVSPAAMGFLISRFNGSYTGAFLFLIGCAALCMLVATTLPHDRTTPDRRSRPAGTLARHR
jgi:MFS family permease